MRRLTLLAAAALATLLLAACATPARLDQAERAQLAALLPTYVLLLAEPLFGWLERRRAAPVHEKGA